MNKTLVFNNVKNIPDVNNVRTKRLSLRVNSKGVPVNLFWRKRLFEGGIELEKKTNPTPTPKVTTPKQTSEVKKTEKTENKGE